MVIWDSLLAMLLKLSSVLTTQMNGGLGVSAVGKANFLVSVESMIDKYITNMISANYVQLN
jgi:hypothetical protein